MGTAAANRYAEALFELAADRGAVDEVAQSLLGVRERLVGDADLSRSFFDRRASVEAKKQIVRQQLGPGLHAFVSNLLLLLCDRRREGGFGALALRYFELKEEKDGILRMKAESALPMDEAGRAALVERLSKATGKSVQLEVDVNPELIGGLRLTVGSTRIDGTIKRRYEDMAQRLRSVV